MLSNAGDALQIRCFVGYLKVINCISAIKYSEDASRYIEEYHSGGGEGENGLQDGAI